MTNAEQWLRDAPYCRILGIEGIDVTPERCELTLPYRAQNANHTGVLHGGVAASLGTIASQAIARTALGEASHPRYTADIQVDYLSIATTETLIAEGRLSRKGRDLCFNSVDIRTQEGQSIAKAHTLVHGRHGSPASPLPVPRLEMPRTGVAPMAERIANNPYIAERGMRMAYQEAGNCVISLPQGATNLDSSGATHEGAALALFDTTGAMAAMSLIDGPLKRASTPSIQAQFLGPMPSGDLEARSQVIHRDGHLFWSDVEVVALSTNNVCIRGTVVYRIIPQ